VGACVLGACSSGDDDGAAAPESSITSSTSDAPTSTEAETESTIESTASTAPQTTIPAASFYGSFDTVIVQRTEVTGVGIRPLLEWEAVPGVDHYGVYLYAPSGAAYWAWRGSETQVYVGGAEQIRADAAGPSVTEGMNWAVVAYDAELLPIAASPMRPISP
jgi:hypothetical protein